MTSIQILFDKWRLLAVTLFFSSIALTGCMTIKTSNMTDRSWEFHSTPLATDDLVAIGKLDPNAETQLDIPGGLVLIGTTQSYVITRGSTELEAVAKSSFGSEIEILEKYNESNSQLYLEKRKFWGAVELRITRDQAFSQREKDELANLGFEIKETYRIRSDPYVYTKSIKLEGITIAPIKTPDGAAQNLTRPRKIAFYPPQDQDAPPSLERYAALPLAVAFDLITAPLQILGLGTVYLMLEAKRGHWPLF